MPESDPTLKQEEVSVTQPNLPLADSLTSKSTKTPKKHRLRPQILVALVILVLISGGVGVGIYQNHEMRLKIATEQANQTATVTEQGNQTATATGQINATATAQHNAYLSALSGNGQLSFSDPLSQENGSQWMASNDEVGVCQFTEGAYEVSQQSGAPKACISRDQYSNFAFEVQLTITQGGCGGINFRDENRTDEAYGSFYLFRICINGRYEIARYANYGIFKQLPYGASPAIHPGLGQPNTIGIRANGNSMTFYVNEQEIAQAQDSIYTSGHIDLIAYPYNGVASVAYSNARLWTL